MTRPKRKYVRLTPSAWAEIDALWEIGDATLPDLAERYCVNTRTLQAHFAKHKVEKGCKAAALAASVKAEVFGTGLGDMDLTVQRARDTREAAYNQALVVESLIMGVLETMQKDPSKSIGSTSALKALALAAASFDRTHGLKLRALGLDKDSVLSEELPVLIFRDLTDEEIKARQEADDEDEGEAFVTDAPKLGLQDEDAQPFPHEDDDDDDRVTEGEDRPEVEEKAVLRDDSGCRFVRGAQP